ncbi:hypothetical protein M431DRAFT_364815 [Trichoderma harzianum CBS 226.95]|uniref:Uncharacterized protein n=1 Tax=Trichoderma harzianum CBS 226.95 TaxID=983964 RepID=A0A2T3ZT71_TRIHA|nr:hypothetical protein M431DRAFT_364815 [Trichoderma harzianum CBS 226.95]PTB47998.1 hypothetical protein M431DRAFT_364815 [Trichoderma harzianum CBS 226.95]
MSFAQPTGIAPCLTYIALVISTSTGAQSLDLDGLGTGNLSLPPEATPPATRQRITVHTDGVPSFRTPMRRAWAIFRWRRLVLSKFGAWAFGRCSPARVPYRSAERDETSLSQFGSKYLGAEYLHCGQN